MENHGLESGFNGQPYPPDDMDLTGPILIQRIAPTRASTLPSEPKERKVYPVASGVLDYFPDALVAIAHVSYKGNEQHNPGQPLNWARE